jgi:hypothetical protein
MIEDISSSWLERRRFLSILAKTLPPATMGFGRKATAALLDN